MPDLDGPIIINGPRWDFPQRAGNPVGFLIDFHGKPVPILSKDPMDLFRALQIAVELPPLPPKLTKGGFVVTGQTALTVGSQSFTVPTLTYDPSDDALNKELNAQFAQLSTNYNEHAKLMLSIVMAMLNHGKKA